MSDENEIKESLNLIQQAIIALDKKIEAQGQRISKLELGGGELASVITSQDSFRETSNENQISTEENLQGTKDDAHIDSDSSMTFSPKESDKTLEENIGGTWFARIGITALVLGVSFLLKYAFDNDWVGDTGKVLIGIFIGMTLLSLGERTIRKYFTYGQILTGGGIAVLYLSIYSAYNYYHLIGSFSAFFCMVIITGVGILLSIRYDALSLMMVAIVGGFMTPLLASTGQNNQLGLLSYLVLLDLAILAVSMYKRWHSLNLVGFFGTAIIFAAWGEKYYTQYDLGITIFFLTIFFIIYSISALIYNMLKKQLSTGAEQLLTLLAAGTYFLTSYNLLNDEYHIFMGFFAIVLAIYYFLWAFVLRNFIQEDKNLYNFLAFLTVGFVTLAIPLQFGGNVITIAWAIEGAILSIVAMQLKKNVLMYFALAVYGFTLLRFLFVDINRYNLATTPIFNGTFLTALMIIASLYVAGWIIKKYAAENELQTGKQTLFAIFMIAANLMTIISISNEIVEAYDKKINVEYSTEERIGQPIYGKSTSYNQYENINLNYAKIEKLQNKKSISLSIFWLVYAMALLAVGVVGKYKGIRLGGLALLALAIFKLFFVDLWSLGTLYRIISSMSLGLVLLTISFVYQKYKGSLREII